MLECKESDHNQQEIILICINMNCQLKRGCCIDCIQMHKAHKSDLKTMKQIKEWKKTTIQNYEIYQKKISQIVEIMGQAEKYLSCMGEDLEKQFEVIMENEYEKQVYNLLRIQQLQSSFNQLILNLETLMEPISQIFSIIESSSKDIWVKAQKTLNISNNKQQIIGQESQIIQEIKIDLGNQEINQKQNRMKIFINLDLIRKENNYNIYQYPRYYKSSIDKLEDYKTIILIGTQSSEKQKLINLFLNYYHDIKLSDSNIFEIADDIDITKERQNDEYEQMKVYYITPQNGKPGLRIIYTPNYSDDLNYDDQNISNRIFDVIYNSALLDQNILIGFVIPQQVQIGTFYMLESVLCKLSNVLIKNIVFLFPDCIDDYPKQKNILQSKTDKINGILSPVLKMIPTMNNIWYLKFNTNTLFVENKTQENQLLWEMGNDSFKLILQDYLQNKINSNKLLDMKSKYDQFFDYISFSLFTQKLEKKFLELYKRDNFHVELSQKYENLLKKMKDQINLQSEKQIYLNNNGEIGYTYQLLNGEKSAQIIYQTMEKFNECINEQHEMLYSFQNKNGDIYDKNFEEFYDLFRNFGNFMIQEYNSWKLFFKFNSILTSINHTQWRYYEHLNYKEQSSKQEGWQTRMKLLSKIIKLYNYFDDCYSKLPNLDQLIKQWSDQNFTNKNCSYVQYHKQSVSSFRDNILQVSHIKLFQRHQQVQIQQRISQNCDQDFKNFIQEILQFLLN
ncbi:unnamed protein product [Paramecium primaurelia]|uniref:Uncharacterized protein n=1 Tax=Paramecium primaurelia TaxID=5886 RepID=A0A8S1PZW6_PARPR|nr:unnamed protein product [Paramecium primaurelia]